MQSKFTSKILYFFVEHFSNSSRECFFEKELPFLEAKFEKVYLVPLYPDDTKLSYTSERIEVLNFDYFQSCNRLSTLLKHFPIVFRIFMFEIFRTHDRSFYFKNFRSQINALLITISATTKLEALIRDNVNTQTIFYSYWFNQWMRSFSILKLKYPDLKVVSRVHGGDYDEVQLKRTIPFRYFQLSKVNSLYPVSEYASNYLNLKFKVAKNRIVVSRLGLPIYNDLSPIDSSNLTLVSCSALIPLKRVHLILDILNYIKTPVTWVHFGNGTEYDSIFERAKSLGEHVTCLLKGHVANKDFINFLLHQPVSFFINVSESEGIPVSMMEAISAGIPLIGTNICGVPEIVKETTGFLIEKDFDPEGVANNIVSLHQKGIIYDLNYRTRIKKYFLDYFSAASNYSKFATQLSAI